jgi:hypothetical protein
MAIRVIGAGYGRTGTASLKMALEQLGFDKCYHMFEVMGHPEHIVQWQALNRGEAFDWDAVFEGYQASVDWPSCNFWQEQTAHYPQAKVILSLRDSERWYESIMNTIYKFSAMMRETGGAQSDMVFELIWDGIFDGRMDDKAHVIGKYLAHNQRVRDTVPTERLLEFEASQGWDPLCQFLDCPIPQSDYPKTNTTEEFEQRLGGGLPST